MAGVQQPPAKYRTHLGPHWAGRRSESEPTTTAARTVVVGQRETQGVGATRRRPNVIKGHPTRGFAQASSHPSPKQAQVSVTFARGDTQRLPAGEGGSTTDRQGSAGHSGMDGLLRSTQEGFRKTSPHHKSQTTQCMHDGAALPRRHFPDGRQAFGRQPITAMGSNTRPQKLVFPSRTGPGSTEVDKSAIRERGLPVPCITIRTQHKPLLVRKAGQTSYGPPPRRRLTTGLVRG